MILQGIILSSYFWGYAATQFPMGTFSERFGGKYLMGFGVLLPSVLTFLTPACIEIGDSLALIILRVIMGMVGGAIYPSASTMISQWSTSSERTRVGSFVYAGGILGTVFGTTLPAIIIQNSAAGWPSVFYYFGAMGMLWFPLWMMLCYNCPSQHPFISESELKYLEDGMDKKKRKKNPPWRHILKSKQFWAFVLGIFGIDWAYYTLASDLPKYMSNVVKFSIEDNGYLSALPYLSMWLSIMANSWFGDQVLKRGWLSKTNMRKVFATIALLGPAIFIVAASYAECDQFMVVFLLVTGMAFMGSAFPSIMVQPLDLSPNYSGTLMAIGNGVAAVGGIATPYVVGYLTTNQTIHEYRQVFFIGLAIAIACSIYIIIFSSAEVQEWNESDFIRKKKKAVAAVIGQEQFKKTVDQLESGR